jgi:PAS domain S-box-containing protein
MLLHVISEGLIALACLSIAAAMLVPLLPKLAGFRSLFHADRRHLELESRYQRLLDTAQEGIWTVDTEARVTFVNQELAHLLGYKQGEILGRLAFDFIVPAEREEAQRHFERQKLSVLRQQERGFEHKDGTTIRTLCSTNPIYDLSNACVGVLGMFADVTEHRRAEAELLRSEDRHRSVAEALPQMVWAATSTGDMYYYSARWFQYTGCPTERLLGWGWQPFLHPADLEGCLKTWTHSLTHGTPFEAENRLKRADGTYRWHLSRALPIRDEAGSIVQWFGTATDIDDQVRTLEAQQRLTEQLQYVVEATDRLTGSLETQESLQTLCELIVPRFGDWIAVNMIEPGDRIRNVALVHADSAKAAAVASLRGKHYVNPAVRGVIAEMIEKKAPTVTHAYDSTYVGLSTIFSEYHDAIGELGLSSVISVPLLVRGRVIGVVSAVWSQSDRMYSEAEVPFFEELAKRAAVAFDEADRHDLAYVNQEITRRIMQSSDDCIAVLSLDGRLITVNEPGAATFGLAGATLESGSEWLTYWRHEHRDVASAALATARSGARGTYEACLKSDDAASRWWDVIVTPIMNAKGVPTQLLAVSRDVTRQKDHETALERVATRYRAFANAMPAMAFTAAPNGTLDYVNDRWTEYTGLSYDVSLQEGLVSALHAEDRPKMAAGWTAALTTGSAHEAEMRLRRANDGVFRWHLMRAVPIRNATGDIVQWFGTGTDIDDQKRAEAAIVEARDAALAAATAKSQFVATMSHEIRTPISGVIGMTELLLITNLSEEQREYASVVRDSGQSLLRVINDILDYSKLDAGKLQLESVEFDVGRQITSVTNLLRSQIEAKRISLGSRVDDDVPPSLLGDPGRVRQILVNLVGNAIKFTPAGGSVHVHVGNAGSLTDRGSAVGIRFEVKDTGIGIPPNVQPRLFEAFAQGDGSTTRKYGGTGLGLSICRQLVSLMDGSIGVESRLGEGAAFWFTIPFGRADARKRALGTSSASQGERRELARTRSHRILLVEDNEINTLVAQRQFEQLGIRITTVSNGLEALQAVKSTTFDVIFMDCHMPEMDGFEATRELRRLERGGTRRLPIVAMTADAQVEDQTACLAAGMDDYLSKPSSLAQLHAVLDRWLPQASLAE